MVHLESPLWRVRSRRVGLAGLVALAMLCLATTYQTNHWINAQFQRDDIPIAAADSPARLSTAGYDALPMVLTIPVAVARTQHMADVWARHESSRSSSIKRIPGLKGAGGLIAGLELLQAMRSHGGR